MAKLSGANIAGLIWNQFLVHKQAGVDVKHVEVGRIYYHELIRMLLSDEELRWQTTAQQVLIERAGENVPEFMLRDLKIVPYNQELAIANWVGMNWLHLRSQRNENITRCIGKLEDFIQFMPYEVREAIYIETDFSIIFRFEKSWCSFQNIDAIPYGI